MSLTATYGEVLGRHDVEIPVHLAADAEIPVISVISGLPQRQGDVAIIPTTSTPSAGATKIPADGIPVVRGENGGNTHLLVGEGTWRPVESTDPRNLDLGELVVEDGAVCYLLHPEHGGQGIGGGVYTVKRKREQADEIRRIAD